MKRRVTIGEGKGRGNVMIRRGLVAILIICASNAGFGAMFPSQEETVVQTLGIFVQKRKTIGSA